MARHKHDPIYKAGWPTMSELIDRIDRYYELLAWLMKNRHIKSISPSFQSMNDECVIIGRTMVVSVLGLEQAILKAHKEAGKYQQLDLQL